MLFFGCRPSWQSESAVFRWGSIQMSNSGQVRGTWKVCAKIIEQTFSPVKVNVNRQMHVVLPVVFSPVMLIGALLLRLIYATLAQRYSRCMGADAKSADIKEGQENKRCWQPYPCFIILASHFCLCANSTILEEINPIMVLTLKQFIVHIGYWENISRDIFCETGMRCMVSLSSV